MPQIIVTADPTGKLDRDHMVHRERINVSDFESEHFATQLVERLGWAVEDADALERALVQRGLAVGAGSPYGSSAEDGAEPEPEHDGSDFDIDAYELARDPRSARVVTTAS